MARARTTRIGGGFGVDTRDLKSLIGALRKAEPETVAAMRGSLVAAGEITANRARAIVEPHSQSVPPTIKSQVRGAAVSVRAGGAGVPVAGLYELGNSGGSQNSTFRHPVFGDRNNWAVQPRYPFLRPAVRDTAPEVEAAVVKAADEVVQTVARWGVV